MGFLKKIVSGKLGIGSLIKNPKKLTGGLGIGSAIKNKSLPTTLSKKSTLGKNGAGTRKNPKSVNPKRKKR